MYADKKKKQHMDTKGGGQIATGLFGSDADSLKGLLIGKLATYIIEWRSGKRKKKVILGGGGGHRQGRRKKRKEKEL